uniref:Isopenicillin N synthase-like Fe(2+) 2OG dioxygenase domain-containing protein n=2 Tax=Populus TaxID=3689 RepID=A0A4U5QFM1_POPAL|nr:hypothetical protein D5086_0000094610 [Populus alba]
MIFLKALPIEDRNLEIWPENPPKFRESLDRYSQDMRQIAVALTRFMAMGLEIESQELYDAYEEGLYQIRMNYYPPCPQPERVTGLNPHVDIAGFALLLDCGDAPGLQVLKDDHWIFVEPLDGAIVVTWGRSQRVGLAKELIKLGSPPLYKTVTVEEYIGCFFNRKLEVPFIDAMKI